MSTNAVPQISEVSITTDSEGRSSVTVFWSGVDRPHGYSWRVGPRALAERLKQAILAGKVLETPQICTDIYGKTYVNASSTILARIMNAELKRLGF